MNEQKQLSIFLAGLLAALCIVAGCYFIAGNHPVYGFVVVFLGMFMWFGETAKRSNSGGEK